MLRGGSCNRRNATEEAVVTTLTLTVVELDEFNATWLGETVHVDCAGAPAQVKDIVWLNPPPGATTTVKDAVCPREMVTADCELGAKLKSCPTPERVTVCGLSEALSVMLRVPVRVPLVAGSKKTPIEQLEPTARLLPHELSCPKSAGVVVTAEMLRGAVPLFINVTVCGRPLVPTY